jgi:serine O-acetyltransferase
MSQFILRDFDSASLAQYVSAQLERCFPDGRHCSADGLAAAVSEALERTRACFTGIDRPKYRAGDDVLYNPLHPDHHAAFLYLLSNVLSRKDRDDPRAFRLFYLNKALHGLDAYHDIELPEVFQFMHPLGTVLGHARYGNHFCVYQGCSVGADEQGSYPDFGDGVVMYAGASVIGACHIGRNVVLGAGSLVLGRDIADNSLVRPTSPTFEVVENRKSVVERRFR